MTAIYAPAPATCTCGFTTRDLALLGTHSCDVQANGGRCEDFPCCGHEYGDCNGALYGSDAAIKASIYAHPDCDHEVGLYNCEDFGDCDNGLHPADDLYLGDDGQEWCDACGCPTGE